MCDLCRKASQLAGKAVLCRICWRKLHVNKKKK